MNLELGEGSNGVEHQASAGRAGNQPLLEAAERDGIVVELGDGFDQTLEAAAEPVEPLDDERVAFTQHRASQRPAWAAGGRRRRPEVEVARTTLWGPRAVKRPRRGAIPQGPTVVGRVVAWALDTCCRPSDGHWTGSSCHAPSCRPGAPTQCRWLRRDDVTRKRNRLAAHSVRIRPHVPVSVPKVGAS